MSQNRLRVISPAPRDVWQALFDADEEAVPYQHPDWFDSLCLAGHYQDISRLYQTEDGRQFILPLVRHRGIPLFLNPAASMPESWGMGGLIGAMNIHPSDIPLVFNDLTRLPYPSISIRPNPRLAALWAAASPKHVVVIPRRAHVLDLQGGFEHVWRKRFKHQTQTAVRKAEREGVVVERDTTGRLVPIFYDLLRCSFDRWACKQHEPRFLTHLRGQARDPLEKFQMVARKMGEAMRIWLAWVNGLPAAAILVLQYRNVNVPRAAMNREITGTSCAGVLLHKMAIEEACNAGCRYYHLGESGESVSLAQFKERFGAIAYPYAEYHIERLPVTPLDRAMRSLVKKAIGFKDA